MSGIDSTCRMLRAAYPHGLSRDATKYRAVIAILYPHCSDRQLAEALHSAFGVDRAVAYNDVLGSASFDPVGHASTHACLTRHGLQGWLRED